MFRLLDPVLRSTATLIYGLKHIAPVQPASQPQEHATAALRAVPELPPEPLPVAWGEFTAKEQSIIMAIYSTGVGRPPTRSLEQLQECFPDAPDSTHANSWARNSLRRPVACGWVERAGRGCYRLSVAARALIRHRLHVSRPTAPQLALDLGVDVNAETMRAPRRIRAA